MTRPNRDRMTVVQVAREYGTSKEKVHQMTVDGLIPFHRVEHFVGKDGPATRYVYLWSIVRADKRRAGELAAEKRAS